jgi:Ca2+-binding RTX toxin-like protein
MHRSLSQIVNFNQEVLQMNSLTKRVMLVAVLATIALLSAAGSAGATVEPPVVTNDNLTVTSDAAGDTITLTVANGFIAVNGTVTTLPADTNAQIVVNSGGGNDTVDATALAATNYNTLTINGGEGDDLLTAGARNDLLEGGPGEDRVIGFKGNDVLHGDDGNDVLVWNNGDATDRDEGGNGVDEVEVNGSPTGDDHFNAKPDAEKPGFVFFERSNLVKFSIESQAERLTVNGLGGVDQFFPDPAVPTGLAGLTSLTLNGGSAFDRLVGGDGADQINGGTGADELFGGEGADQINGGEESDRIEGEGGDDRIVGGTGSDSLEADAGDDTIVWNNGDGSDPVNEGGSGFDRVEVNGSATAGDATQFVANATEASFVRTNLVAFTLEIAPDNEVLAFNGGGGNDTFKVIDEGSAMTVAADGGAGNDELIGAGEADSYFGGSGNDLLTGGTGNDVLDGQEGDDRLLARDGVGDLVRGGTGDDSAQTDRITVDAVDGVETLEATPAPVPTPGPPPTVPPEPRADTVALLPTVGRFSVTRSHGKLIARAPVTCPVAEAGGCRAAITLETAKALQLGKVNAVLVLGSTDVSLAPGQSKTVPVRVNGGAAALARKGKLATRVQVSSSDAAGNTAARSVAVGLRIPRR